MPELEANWSRTLSVWWLIIWRTMAGGLFLGLLVGLFFGIFAATAGLDASVVRPLITIFASLVGLLWGVIVIRMALRKTYRRFRIALHPVVAN